MAAARDPSEFVCFASDKWNWSRSIDDVERLRWCSYDFARQRAIWLDNVTRAGDRLHSNTIVLLGRLSNYVSQADGYAFPSIDRLAADVGWSRSSAERALKEGKAGGWLEWCKPKFRESNAYRLSYSPQMIAEIRERFELRMHAIDPTITSKLTWLGMSSNHVTSDAPTTSDLTDQSRQIRRTILTREPHKGFSEDGLGDKTREVELPREAGLPADLADDVRVHHHVLVALGRGQLDLGRIHADILGRGQLGQLKELVAELGLVETAEVLERAAARAEQIIISKQKRETSNVVA